MENRVISRYLCRSFGLRLPETAFSQIGQYLQDAVEGGKAESFHITVFRAVVPCDYQRPEDAVLVWRKPDSLAADDLLPMALSGLIKAGLVAPS